jgi:RNA polymerase sigma-70 factor, ECF subfamily
MEDAGAPPARAPDRPDAEARLLAALRAGEPRAFELLVREHGPRMRAAIVRLRGPVADVDDALQDAFLAAFRGLAGFEGRSRLSTWLHRIAVNAALMRARARRDEPAEDLEGLLPQFSPHGAFIGGQRRWAEAPEVELQREELRAGVRAAIDRLPENYRIPLVLRDIEGLSHAEIAEGLGTSVNAAKIRVHRARQALKTLLEQTLPGPPR